MYNLLQTCATGPDARASDTGFAPQRSDAASDRATTPSQRRDAVVLRRCRSINGRIGSGKRQPEDRARTDGVRADFHMARADRSFETLAYWKTDGETSVSVTRVDYAWGSRHAGYFRVSG